MMPMVDASRLSRLRMTPSESKQRLMLSLTAAAGANLGGLLGDHPPTAWQWVKIAVSTIVVVAVNWRAFITNPQATTNDPVPATPSEPAPTNGISGDVKPAASG